MRLVLLNTSNTGRVIYLSYNKKFTSPLILYQLTKCNLLGTADNNRTAECDSPPEPAPPEVPPRGPSLHVTLRHRGNMPAEQPPTEADRLYLSEGKVI